jgi:hypothetical protein
MINQVNRSQNNEPNPQVATSPKPNTQVNEDTGLAIHVSYQGPSVDDIKVEPLQHSSS